MENDKRVRAKVLKKYEQLLGKLTKLEEEYNNYKENENDFPKIELLENNKAKLNILRSQKDILDQELLEQEIILIKNDLKKNLNH